MKTTRLAFASIFLLVSTRAFATDMTATTMPTTVYPATTMPTATAPTMTSPTTSPTAPATLIDQLYMQLAMEIQSLCGPVEEAPVLDLTEVFPPEDNMVVSAGPMDATAEIYREIDILYRKLIYKQGHLMKLEGKKTTHEARIAGFEAQKQLLGTKRDLANANGYTALGKEAQIQIHRIEKSLENWESNLETLKDKIFHVEFEIKSLKADIEAKRKELP